MATFRKQPVLVEAEQFLGGDIGDTVEMHGRTFTIRDSAIVGPHLDIETREGTMMAGIGSWIIRGVEGELYPCPPSVFAATYQKVS